MKITVQTEINAPLAKVWNCWTEPQHIVNWNFASDDWHCPAVTNELKKGGKFSYTMAAKNGSFSFDFEGEYTLIEPQRAIEYTMSDGRACQITFEKAGDLVLVTETFDAENTHIPEMQRSGWQAILDNFRKCAESA